MKISEILELTNSMNIAAIAKDRLTIGEKRVRAILKELGCTNQAGKKGWSYTGDDPELLEKSIYDFIQPIKRKAKAINNASIEIASTSEIQANKPLVKASRPPIKSELDTIDRLLLQNDSDNSQRVYRGFYWDSDIIKVIDGIKHGNKSDLLNEIVRRVLKEKGLIE